ncbi:MAG: hypothetical protein IPJ81_16975 [Chitinophagaceae bacterium]|nr:hypothetical protein [Chitinophagaceae bacterium]
MKKQKRLFLIIVLIFSYTIIQAQQKILLDSIEFSNKRKAIIQKFEKQKNIIKTYMTEQGEDETSGWYYIYYYDTKLLKIRVIWNGGCCQKPTVTDLYYKDTTLILLDVFEDMYTAADKVKVLDNLIKGKNVQLKLNESLLYDQQHLIGYINNEDTSTEGGYLAKQEKWGLEWGEIINDFDKTKLKAAPEK